MAKFKFSVGQVVVVRRTLEVKRVVRKEKGDDSDHNYYKFTYGDGWGAHEYELRPLNRKEIGRNNPALKV